MSSDNRQFFGCLCLLSILFLNSVSATDIYINFQNTTEDTGYSYSVIPSHYAWTTVSDVGLVLNTTFNADFVSEIRLVEYPNAEGGTAQLDSGAITIDSSQGFSATGISCASGTGCMGLGLIIVLNETFLLEDSNSSTLFANVSGNDLVTGLNYYQGSADYVWSVGSGVTGGNDLSINFSNSGGNNTDRLNTVILRLRSDDASGSATFNLTGLRIRGLTPYSSNALPTLNLTEWDDICYNPDLVSSLVSIKYTVQDQEGDTIYYATDFRTNKNVNQTIRYNKRLFGNFVDTEDWTFLPGVYNDGSYCKINTGDYNGSQLNLVEYLIDDTPLIDYSKYMLRLASDCTGTKEFIYTIPQSLYNSFYASQMYGFSVQNESFNVVLYDSSFNEQTKIRYRIDQGNVTIGYYNSSGVYRPLTNYTVVNDTEFSINDYTNQTTGTLLDFTSGRVLTYEKISNLPIKYIGLQFFDTEVYQRYFAFTGRTPTLSWSTTPFSNAIEIFESGLYNLNFYLSDNIHVPSSYVRYSFQKTIPTCDYYVNFTVNDPDLNNTFNPLNFMSRTFGSSFTNYLNDLGYYSLAKNIFWFVFIFLLFSFIVGDFLIFRRLEVSIPLFLSSSIMTFMGYMMSYSGGVIGSLIFMAVSLAMIFAPNLFGGSYDGR